MSAFLSYLRLAMKNSKSIAEESIIIARRHENVKTLQQFAILREYNVVFMCIL